MTNAEMTGTKWYDSPPTVLADALAWDGRGAVEVLAGVLAKIMHSDS